MQKNQPILFVEINYKSYVFIAGVYDDNQSFRLLEKIITDNEGITKNKLSDINDLYYGDISKWLCMMSYSQFTKEELINGTAKRIVDKYHG